MDDYSFTRVLSQLEHGYRAVIRLPDGDVDGDVNAESFKRKYKNYVGDTFKLTDEHGNYMQFDIIEKAFVDTVSPPPYNDGIGLKKYTYSSDPRAEFIIDVAMDLARKKGLEGKGIDAVNGFVVSRLESIENRLSKYYTMNWHEYIGSDNILRRAMVRFLKNYFMQNIDEIALYYSRDEGAGRVNEDESLMSDGEGVEEDEAEGMLKANYFNDNVGMTQMMNTNYDVIAQDNDDLTDTGSDEDDDRNPDLYRREMNRINEMKRKAKHPEGVYVDVKGQREPKY